MPQIPLHNILSSKFSLITVQIPGLTIVVCVVRAINFLTPFNFRTLFSNPFITRPSNYQTSYFNFETILNPLGLIKQYYSIHHTMLCDSLSLHHSTFHLATPTELLIHCLKMNPEKFSHSHEQLSYASCTSS